MLISPLCCLALSDAIMHSKIQSGCNISLENDYKLLQPCNTNPKYILCTQRFNQHDD